MTDKDLGAKKVHFHSVEEINGTTYFIYLIPMQKDWVRMERNLVYLDPWPQFVFHLPCELPQQQQQREEKEMELGADPDLMKGDDNEEFDIDSLYAELITSTTH